MIKPRILITLTIVLTASTLFADGFRNPPEGARAVGKLGAHRAFADDATAVIHNPANLVDRLLQRFCRLTVQHGSRDGSHKLL